MTGATFLAFFLPTILALGERAQLDLSASMQQYSLDLTGVLFPWRANIFWRAAGLNTVLISI